MPRVYVSSVLPAPAKTVWQRVRDFNGLPRWHPRIRESRIEEGLPADKVGCVRAFALQNGDRLREQLAAIESEIAEMGATAVVGVEPGRKRARNAESLVDAMRRVLTGTELTVTELSDAVQAAGYVTTSPNFRTIVNQTLIKYPKMFKRVARGVYTSR